MIRSLTPVTGLLLAFTVTAVACDNEVESGDDGCVPAPAGERCGGGDEDCDGLTDEAGAAGCQRFYLDADGDGFGDNDSGRCLCAPLAPYLAATISACGGVECDDGNPCTEDSCDPTNGECRNLNATGDCEDGDPCTAGEACDAGTCVGGAPVTCDDGDPCTEDVCLAGAGCRGIPTPGLCDPEPRCGDGRCDEGETCAVGATDGVCEQDCSPLGFGRCGEACDLSAQRPCGEGAVCVPEGEGGRCLTEMSACDPVANTGCPGGESCAWLGEDGPTGFARLCRPDVGSSPKGGECQDDGGCARSLVCLRGTCRTGCKPDVSSCGVGERCQDLAPGLPLGLFGACVGDCGDNVCGPREGCRTCESDCGPCEVVCGDNVCDADQESCESCPGDCGDCPTPTDGSCHVSETCATAPDDCGACPDDCGDGICAAEFESCVSCKRDCGNCVCGDGECAASETAESCRADCGVGTCGDGRCQDFEHCGSCASDCGACARGDGVCSRPAENCDNTPEDCETCLCGDGVCGPSEDCDNCSDDCSCAVGDGKCTRDESCIIAPEDCGPCTCGDRTCEPEAGENGENCPSDCPRPRCGDGRCDSWEECSVCEDCGPCDPNDGVCASTESCETAPNDCGPCVGACGDGFCQNNESCADCQVDCGDCPMVCGDGFCAPGETCESCVLDCRECPAVCGDGLCGTTETCLSCPGDCRWQLRAWCGEACALNAPSCPPNYLCTDVGDDDGQVSSLISQPGEQGVCLGQPEACDFVTQAGCTGDETCGPLAGEGGVVWVCSQQIGDVWEGDVCLNSDSRAELCQSGLHCVDGACRVPCKPGGAPCNAGTCVDDSEAAGLSVGTIGVCR
jgi:hypothetical protein